MVAFVGPETIAIVAVIAVIIFGGSKIPELARSLGRAKGEFQKGMSEGDAAKDQKANKEPAKTDDQP